MRTKIRLIWWSYPEYWVSLFRYNTPVRDVRRAVGLCIGHVFIGFMWMPPARERP